MSDYYDQTPEQRRQLRAQRNRRRQAQVRRRKLLLGLLVLAVLAVVLILVLRGCGKDKEPAQPTPSENVDKPDTPNTPVEPSDREQNQKPDDQQRNGEQEIPWNLTLVNRWNPLPEGWTVDEVELSNGWAVDIVDLDHQLLDESQEQTAVQQWLMTNSWRYGFILRYPTAKTETTGIIYEPWHYRYVGQEAAAEIYQQGVCLEEYIAAKYGA